MGVESLEHAAYGVLHELVLIKRVDVKTIDGKLGNLQFTNIQHLCLKSQLKG